MEVDKGLKSDKIESKGFVYGGLKQKKEYEGCIRCLELYDKITKADDKCATRWELDIGMKNSVIESLEGKLGFMELKNLKLENEVRMLTQRNEELEKSIPNRKEEDDKLTLLMIENKVLECEKKKAEIDMGAWKVKCTELEIEMQVLELEKRMKSGGSSAVQTQTKTNEDKDASGNPTINTPSKQHIDVEGFKGGRKCELKSRVGKCLDFASEWNPHNNISPSTPGIRPPFVPIEISDSDDDLTSKNVQNSTGVGLGINPDEKELSSKDRCGAVVDDHSDEEKTICYVMSPPNHPMPKRKKVKRGVAYVVTSESESDSDDNIPIGKLMSQKLSARSSDARQNGGFVNDSGSKDNRKKHTPRRRLKRVGENEDNFFSGKSTYKSTRNRKKLKTPEIMKMEKDDSSSEGESLGGFIVDSSDVSESDFNDGTSSGDCSDDSETESSMAYDEVISGLRRERKNKITWEYEADMLADLCKCPEMCMKAVCAIYRRQTSEEKSRQATILLNRRGFSQSHASIGSDLAEFLTNGNPQGDVKKSVKELQEFDSEGVKECRKLATHYSRQLFEIYKNREDPFFHPL